MKTNEQNVAGRNCASRLCRRIVKIFSIVPSDATSVQWKFLFVSALGVMAQSIHVSTVYPFITQLLRHVGIEESSIIYYAGIASTSYYSGAFVGCYLCGFLSDYLGRKPVILMALVGSLPISMLLGFCTSFPMLLSARVLAGIINGSIVAHKTLINDISDESNLAVGLGFYVYGWCASSVVGSFVGGLLVEPAVKYPDSAFALDARLAIFRDFPYLLPCLLIASVNFVTAIVVAIILPETKNLVVAPTRNAGDGDGVDKDHDEKEEEEKIEFISPKLARGKNIDVVSHRVRRQTCATRRRDSEMSNYSLHLPPYDSFPPICAAKEKRGFKNDENQRTIGKRNKYDKTDGNNNVGIDDSKVDGKETSALLPGMTPNAAADSLVGRGPLTVILLYAVYSLVAISTEEIIPVWTSTSTNYGGLNFTTSETALSTGSPAFFVLLLTLYIAPVLINRIGVRWSCLIGLFTLAISLPALTLGEFMGAYVVPYICIFRTLIRLGGSLAFIVLSVVCCNCVSRSRNGAMNGLASSVSYVTRVFGPYLLGYLYSWSITPLTDGSSRSFPFDFHLTFFALSVGVLFCSILAFFLLKFFEKK